MANSDEDLKSETGDEATGDADESKPLTITVQDIGPARKCLTIEVPADRISGKFDDSYKQLQSDANIPGFRKGRAPRRLIERRFSTTVRDDVKGQLISECFAQAVDDHKLEVIGEPDMKELETIELPEDGPLKFQVEVEVAPTVELPPLEGIAVNDQTVPVKEADVDQELEALCQRFGNVTTGCINDLRGAGITACLQLVGRCVDGNHPRMRPASHHHHVEPEAATGANHCDGIVGLDPCPSQ